MRATHPLEFIKLTTTEPPYWTSLVPPNFWCLDIKICRVTVSPSQQCNHPPTYYSSMEQAWTCPMLHQVSELLVLPSVAEASQTWHHMVSHVLFNTFKLFKSKSSALALTAFLYQLTQNMLSPITCLPTPDTWLSLLCAHTVLPSWNSLLESHWGWTPAL